MDTDANALEAARDIGYHQMADHGQQTLIERLEFAVDSDRQLAAALRPRSKTPPAVTKRSPT